MRYFMFLETKATKEHISPDAHSFVGALINTLCSHLKTRF